MLVLNRSGSDNFVGFTNEGAEQESAKRFLSDAHFNRLVPHSRGLVFLSHPQGLRLSPFIRREQGGYREKGRACLFSPFDLLQTTCGPVRKAMHPKIHKDRIPCLNSVRRIQWIQQKG